jgi:amino acid efflux transporter
MTVVHGTALYLGAVLGTGVIALPALAASIAGPASLLAWLGLVIVSAPLAATFAALGARHPDAGGVSTYVRRAFGDRAAAIVGWCFFWPTGFGMPAAGMFGGQYVAAVLGGGQGTALVTTAVLIAAVFAMNAFGVRVSGRIQVGLSVLLVTLLVLAVLCSLPHAHLANLRPFAPHGWSAIVPAASLLVWSFVGWEAVTHLAADFRRPRRDLPRATALAVCLVGLLYLAVAVMTILVLGPGAASARAPLGELLAAGLGGSTRLLAAIAALLLTFGTMNAYCAGGTKLGAALARDGALPGWLAHGSRVGEVPRRSLAVLAVTASISLVVMAAAHIATAQLVRATTGAFVLVYLLGMLAALRLLPRGTARGVAVVALVVVAGLLASTGWYLVSPAVLALGALCYQLRRPRRRTIGGGAATLTGRQASSDQPWLDDATRRTDPI